MNLNTKEIPSRGSKSILRSSVKITSINVLGSVIGFLTNATLAASFGAGAEMDALLVSQTIPFLVLAVLGTASNFAVIPVLGDLEHRGDRTEAVRTTSILITTFVLLLAIVSLGAWLAGDLLIGAIAPGLSGKTHNIAVELLAIQAPLVVVSGLGSLLSSIHSSRKDYYHGPLANLLGALVMLACIFILRQSMGIKSAAVGAFGSSLVVFFLLLVPHLKRYPFRPTLSWRGSAALTVLGLMTPLLLGAIFYRGDAMIQRFFASSLPAGSISSLGYGQKTMSLFSMVLASGMPVVALSHFAESIRKNDRVGLEAAFTSTFRWMTFACVGAIVFIGVCGRELIEILFMRGRFDLEMVQATDRCLVLYSGLLFSGVLGTLITPVFYAHKDTRTVVMLGVSGTVLQVVLSLVLTHWLAVLGLPLAYSISNVTAVATMLIVLKAKHLDFGMATIMRFVMACMIAGTVSVVIVRLGWPESFQGWGVWLRLAVKGFGVCGLYLVSSLVIGSLHVLSQEHPRLKALNLPRFYKLR